MGVRGSGPLLSLAPLSWDRWDESGSDGAIQPESGVGDLAPITFQVIPPSDRGEKQTGKSQFTRSGLPKPTHPIE